VIIGASATIGDGVWINFGTVIASKKEVKIGRSVMIGQHCIVSDVEVPEMAVNARSSDAKPIEIGDGAWLAGRVTVRPGVKIGEGAVITAGSVGATDIPARVVAGASRPGFFGPRPTAARRASRRRGGADGHRCSRGALRRRRVFGDDRFDFTIDELPDELRSAKYKRP
jgi:acyl-[acyl carrier protein]--UDP-N-acetylglucosamine O-acyltransferase